jgi:peptide-methionine (R)-S-oxide reductase
MKNSILSIVAVITFSACAQKPKEEKTTSKNQTSTIEKIVKPESEWKSILTADEYYVLREKGTERAFTSDLLNIKDIGTYVCAACQLPLFESETKFKSGTGWPSFFEPINNENVAEESDRAYGMVRTEVLCARCDGHLGHVFPDGPKPTGLRYCINGDALKFQKKEK